jgi:hypothetical protein
MSECVVRMEMPQNCGECRFRSDGWCYGIREFDPQPWPLDFEKRPSWCPIICQLPEGHGRLVSEKSVRWAIDDIVLEIANRTGRVGMTKDETMEYINNLCTIVPAERSET